MALDLSALRAKLNELSNRTRFSDIIFKPQEGTNIIRIVPLVSNPSFPFVEAHFHYLGGKTYLSPLTFGEADPIEEFAQKLRGDGGLSKEEWEQTKKFVPKLRTFVPVIVRGKETEGVRFWGFGKTTYKELLSFMEDEDYGDIVDIKTGRDIKIEFTPGEKSDTKFPQTTIKVHPKQTPLTTDATLLEKLLTIQPDLYDAYPRLSYDDLKEVLNKYLSPSAKSATPASADAAGDDWSEETETPTEKVVSKSPTTKKSKEAASKIENIEADFEAMFNEK